MIALRRAALALGSVLLALAGAQAVAPLLTGGRYSLQHFQFADWPDMSPFQPSSILPYELVPNVKGFTNSLGMRDREHALAKRPGVTRIAVFNDSIGMYGHWPDRLQDELDREFPGRFDVWNWSIGGFGLQDYDALFEKRAIDYQPDVVLLGLELFDVKPTRVVLKDWRGKLRCYRPFSTGSPVDTFLYGHSYLYRMWMMRREAREGLDVQTERGMEDFARPSLRRIEALAARRRIKVLAVIFPRMKPLDQYSGQEREAWAAIRGLLDADGIPYRDLQDAFPARGRERYRMVPGDVVHFNALGDRVIVGATMPLLRSVLGLGRR